MNKIQSFIWKALLILIFLRPFLSEHAFLTVGFCYVSGLIFFLCIYSALFRKINFFSPMLNFSVLIFIAAILISVIFSRSTEWSLFELYLFIPNILIFYIVSKIRPEQQKQLINTIFFAASIIGIYAIYQYFFGLGHTLEYIKQTRPNIYAEEFLNRRRVFATFVSPNIFVSYNLMMLFLGMGLSISIRQREKITYWICTALMTTSLILSKSLGGILVFVVTFIIFTFFIFFYLLPKLEFKRITLKRIASISAVFLFAFIIISGIFVRQRLAIFFNINDPNNSIIQRFYYWKASLNMVKDSWLTGIGWRKFGLLYRFYKLPSANVSHYSHNIFLQILAETGIFGFLIFAWIIFLFLKAGFGIVKEKADEQGLKIGLFCAGCAFLLHNLVDLSFYFGQASFFWWIILGLFSNFSSKNA